MSAPIYALSDRAGVIYEADTGWLHCWSGATDVLIHMDQDELARLIRTLNANWKDARTLQSKHNRSIRYGELLIRLNAGIAELRVRIADWVKKVRKVARAELLSRILRAP